MCHRLVTRRDTHKRGVMLITGAVTLVTWPFTLVTRLYMRKMEVTLLDRTLLVRAGHKAVEMCGPSAFFSWLSHLVRSGQARGQDIMGAS